MKADVFELTENDLRKQMSWLRGLAFSLVGTGTHAEDAVQETMVAALEHPPALDRDVRPWLARVLANLISKRLRSDRRRRNRETPVGEAYDGPPAADELLVRHEAARVVAGLVSALRDPHRGLVLLRFAEGLTAAEIARQRNIPEGTVRRQLKEALDQLREEVAAHYGREARDWRLALLPLAANPREALSGLSKGGAMMTVKSKLVLGLAAAALAVTVLVMVVRGRTPAAEPGRQAAAAGTGETRPTALALPGVPRARNLAPAATAAGGGPPTFATSTAADPPDCGNKLASMRTLASERLLPSPAVFERARPSPRMQAEVAPIVERVIGGQAGKAGYQLECRTSVCRVGVVGDPSAREPPAWFEDLGEDAALRALRGRRAAFRNSAMTKDALTGASLLHHWLYIGVPMAGDEEHPFEGGASATTCGERVAALEKALDEQRAEQQRFRDEEKSRQRRLEELPVNPELTARVQAAFRRIASDPTGAPVGVWDCRGASDCRWRGPASVVRFIDRTPAAVDEALASQGLAYERIRTGGDKDSNEAIKEGESEVVLVVRDLKKDGTARR